MNLYSSIEPLESRIAPAALSTLVVTGNKATYHDVDGDIVTVTVSAGTLTAGLFSGVAGAHGDQLQTLDLSGGGFAHANVTVTVKKAASGDGLANIGYLNSTGHDLGNVSIQGDLGQIDAGDAVADGGVKSLKVNSMGRLGTDTQDNTNPNFGLESDILNGLGSLAVTHDVNNVFIKVTGFSADADGTVGPITIGGSLIGSATDDGGQIRSTGNMGAVTIGEDIRGGSGDETGMINSGGTLGNVTVHGSLLGGYLTSNTESGEIRSVGAMGAINIGHDVVYGSGSLSGYIEAANPVSGGSGSIASLTIGGSLIGNSISGGTVESGGNLGNVKIGHDILGGLINSDGGIGTVTLGGSLLPGTITSSGVISCGGNMGMVSIGHDIEGTSVLFSGLVFALGNIKGVHVGGSIIGGSGNTAANVNQSGGIIADGDIGPVTVMHNLLGGKNGASHTLSDSGVIEAGGRMTGVTIDGSIISGGNFGSGAVVDSGAIIANEDIGSLAVLGSIIGGAGSGHAVIAAGGQAAPTGTTDLAIGKITVGYRVENTQILGGYVSGANGPTPMNADAQIGPVKVGGDWIASSLVAGAINAGADVTPGTSDDNMNFGDSEDMKITGGTDHANVLSKIASITISGLVFGTPDSVSSSDHFGFVAEAFGAVKIGGLAIPIPALMAPVAVGETDDVSLDRIA